MLSLKHVHLGPAFYPDNLNVDTSCAGKWANEVSHPSGGVTKEYVVTTSDYPNKQQLKGIEEGCLIDGTEVKPIAVQLETSDPHLRNKLRIVLAEGKNREVRDPLCYVACNRHIVSCAS